MPVISHASSLPESAHPGVLINPKSGRNRIRPVDAYWLSEEFGVPVREACNQEEVDSVLLEFAKSGVNVVVVSSGDGTVQAVHTSIFSRKMFEQVPFMVVVPGGTTNMTATDVGVNCSLPGALEMLISTDLYAKAWVECREIIRLDLPDHEERFGLFFATAGICDAMRWYRENMHGRGLWGLPGIVLTFAGAVMQEVFMRRNSVITPRRIELSTDGGEASNGLFTIFFATTLHHLLWGMRPFASCEACGDDMLHIGAISPGAERVWREILSLILRKRLSSKVATQKGYLFRDVREAELLLDGEIALDGEVYRVNQSSGRLKLEMGGVCAFIRW